jgi:hypothetical protein
MKLILPWIFPVFRSLLFILGGLLLVGLTGDSNTDLIKW